MNETLIKLLCELSDNKSPKTTDLKVGRAYLIRTVTMMYTGRVVAINDFNISLEDAAWIADSGRYNNALVTGELNEAEPYPNGVGVSLQSIVDFAPWNHSLPREVK